MELYPTAGNGGFPDQETVEGDLKSSLVTLKTVMRVRESRKDNLSDFIGI